MNRKNIDNRTEQQALRDAKITRINTQFVGSDTLSIEEMQARIDSLPLKPPMIIKTGKPIHIYWFIKNDKSRNYTKE